MIRILYYGLNSNRGGIENYLLKICKHLDKEKFGVAFIDETGGKACHRRELEEMGAVFYDITHRCKSILKNKRDLKNLFRKERFDILHFNCNTLSYITPIITAQKYETKIILHSRNSKCKASPITRIFHYLNKIKLKKSDIYRLAVSDIAGKWFFGKASYQVLNNGVEVNRFAFDTEKREAIRHKMGLDGKTVYCNVGVLLKVKNHFFLLKVFEEIYSRNKNAVLLLAGEGMLRTSIEKCIQDTGLSDAVYLLGSVNNVEEILLASDCMIFPSLYEGFPNAVLEAETIGLPVLMSDVITEEVCLTDQCIRMPLSKSAEEWAQKAEELAGGSWEREKSAETVIQKGYSTENEIRKIEAIYQGVAAR